MAIIDYTTVRIIEMDLVRFDCSICNAYWYVENKQLDYQSYIGCVMCGVVSEIESDTE